jgi:hypothetical protein
MSSASGIVTSSISRLVPLTVNAASSTGKWRITTEWNDELAEKVVRFLMTNDFEFYTTGKALSEQSAQNVVKSARARAEAGIPFTRFVVLDNDRNVIGEFALGFDDNPRKLQLAGRGLKNFHNQGIGKEIIQWCLKQYISELHRKEIRFPVYAEGQDHVAWKDKKVVEWIDLRKVVVVATVHPDYQHGNNLLIKSGFSKVSEMVKENFDGVHDGRRNVYEIALKNFIKPSALQKHPLLEKLKILSRYAKAVFAGR